MNYRGRRIDHLIANRAGERRDDVHGVPVVRLHSGDRSRIDLAEVMIAVDSAAPRR